MTDIGEWPWSMVCYQICQDLGKCGCQSLPTADNLQTSNDSNSFV